MNTRPDTKWFERLTGFREGSYDDTRRQLAIEGQTLRSLVNGRTYGVGELELVSLETLRQRVHASKGCEGSLKVRNVQGDVGPLHRAPAYAGALFQVASQFNMLEMNGSRRTPEDGVTCYAEDLTQGPACAMAAGAATLYRNYFAPVGHALGQTRDRQLDGLADVGTMLAGMLGRPVGSLWLMKNGYALCYAEGLAAIDDHLASATEDVRDALRGALRVGLHRDVEVTDEGASPGQQVSQVFCSALPVGYAHDILAYGARTAPPAERWAAFATLVLEAAYEATLWAAVLNARRGASNIVLLTHLGGSAFGNDLAWIEAAMKRALKLARGFALEVVIVNYRETPASMRALEKTYP